MTRTMRGSAVSPHRTSSPNRVSARACGWATAPEGTRYAQTADQGPDHPGHPGRCKLGLTECVDHSDYLSSHPPDPVNWPLPRVFPAPRTLSAARRQRAPDGWGTRWSLPSVLRTAVSPRQGGRRGGGDHAPSPPLPMRRGGEPKDGQLASGSTRWTGEEWAVRHCSRMFSLRWF